MKKKQSEVINGSYINDGWEGQLLRNTNILSSAWSIQEIFRMLYAKKVIHENENINKVLDIGCSDGVFMQVYAGLARDFGHKTLEYVGVDMRQSALDKLDEIKEGFGKAQADLISTAVVDYTDKDDVKAFIKEYGKFDCVIAFEVIEHFDRSLADNFLKYINKSLNDEGLLIISTPVHHIEGEEMYYGDSHAHEFMYNDLLEVVGQEFEILHVVGNHGKAKSLKAKLKGTEFESTYKRLLKETKMNNYVNSLFLMLYPELCEGVIIVGKKR